MEYCTTLHSENTKKLTTEIKTAEVTPYIYCYLVKMITAQFCANYFQTNIHKTKGLKIFKFINGLDTTKGVEKGAILKQKNCPNLLNMKVIESFLSSNYLLR